MKKLLKPFALLLLASAVFVACNDKGNDDGGKITVDPPFEIDIPNMFSGAVKAGKAGAIEIIGTGFDKDVDYIYIGYSEGGEIVYERIPDSQLTLLATRVSIGVHVSAGYLDKTVKVYLDRPGYDKIPISGDITFTLPEVSEGYIPDAGLRASLSSSDADSGNPNIAPFFDVYGMLDVTGAAGVTSMVLAGCQALSLEGIELFTNVAIVRGWDMPNIEEIDLSKWTAKGLEFYCERAGKLKKLIGAPFARTIVCHSSPALTHVDVHNCNWLTRLVISEAKTDAALSAVTYLDMRRNHSGTWKQSPSEETDFQIWGGDSHLKVAGNATIKIDSWFLFDHNVADSSIPSCWYNIYDAWKNRGATIEVYSRVDPYRDQLLGTVPMASVDPDALSPNNKRGDLQPANKWQIDDPHTTENEAPGL